MSVHPGIKKQLISKEKGHGLVATHAIQEGTIVLIDDGRQMTVDAYLTLSLVEKRGCYQIDADTFLAPFDFKSPNLEMLVNHSCDPNLIHVGGGIWKAGRKIEKGEELTHDYAVFQTNQFGDFDSYTCCCGAPLCRRLLSGDDWMDKSLQLRYAGQFFPSVQVLINREKAK